MMSLSTPIPSRADLSDYAAFVARARAQWHTAGALPHFALLLERCLSVGSTYPENGRNGYFQLLQTARWHLPRDGSSPFSPAALSTIDNALDAERVIEFARLSRGDNDKVSSLWLGIKHITAEVAMVLAQFDGPLHLMGWVTPTGEACAALAAHQGEISLGLNEINPCVAEALAPLLARDSLTRLVFPALSSIDLAAAEGLAKCTTRLQLTARISLNAPVAAALARSKSPELTMTGLEAPSSETLQALAAYRGQLVIGGQINEEGVITLLAQSRKLLKLPDITVLTVALAEAIRTTACQNLFLPALSQMSSDIAAIIANAKCDGLSLGGITTLDLQSAQFFSQRIDQRPKLRFPDMSAQAQTDDVQALFAYDEYAEFAV